MLLAHLLPCNVEMALLLGAWTSVAACVASLRVWIGGVR